MNTLVSWLRIERFYELGLRLVKAKPVG